MGIWSLAAPHRLRSLPPLGMRWESWPMGVGVPAEPWKLPWSHTLRQRPPVCAALLLCMAFRPCMMLCVLTLAPLTPLPHHRIRRIRGRCRVLRCRVPSYNRAFPVTRFSPLVGVKTVTGNATIAWTVRFSHLCQVLICALFSLLCCIPRRRLTHRWGWGIPLGTPLTNQVGQPTAPQFFYHLHRRFFAACVRWHSHPQGVLNATHYVTFAVLCPRRNG